jgi:antitoxin (DNA-binding transcriptional repressor) of toxin-antitoxin stability system
MKTPAKEPRRASVRDLRNRFADVAKWIEDGESVSITRGGTDFAILAPARSDKPGKPDWAAWLKANPPIPAKRKLTPEETQAFYDDMRGAP